MTKRRDDVTIAFKEESVVCLFVVIGDGQIGFFVSF